MVFFGEWSFFQQEIGHQVDIDNFPEIFFCWVRFLKKNSTIASTRFFKNPSRSLVVSKMRRSTFQIFGGEVGDMC